MLPCNLVLRREIGSFLSFNYQLVGVYLSGRLRSALGPVFTGKVIPGQKDTPLAELLGARQLFIYSYFNLRCRSKPQAYKTRPKGNMGSL